MRCFLRVSALVFLTAVLCVPFSQGASLEEKTYYKVERVIDGDTLRLQGGVHVRLIGIDTPERKANDKMLRDIRRRGGVVEDELKAGLEAYRFTKKLAEGQQVHLEFDEERQDRYKRVLAYVFLKNGLFINTEIVKQGYAYPYPVKPNVRYAKLIRHLYQQAKKAGRGLWGKAAESSSKKSVYK